MSFLYGVPIIGAVALATGTVLEKTILKVKNINVKQYQTLGFLAIIITMLPFVWFLWRIESQALTLGNLGILGAVVIFSIVANLFTFYSMKWEKVSNLEPAKILEPLFVIVLAIIFSFVLDSSLYERNLNILVPAIIAGLALVFSHIKKHHLNFNKYFIFAIFGSFFFALELVISRLILDFYSPISFYFIRCLSIFVISLIAFRPNLKGVSTKIKWQILIAGAIWVVYRVMIYYGYLHLGIAFTTLTIMLGPVFIYLFAWKFLREKIEMRNIIVAAIIVASILYALIT
ncbi:MAG: DMT family transporter [Nanoarchaeota archaeon]|nr:DMT family transporter [Nanoarchaeota archaeon]